MKTMQCAVGIFVLTIVAGAFYRPASMYHPRRKMIMHIKNQKKTRRDQEEVDPPYFDFSALRMRGLQALMIISSIAAFGIFVPFVILVNFKKFHFLLSLCHFGPFLVRRYLSSSKMTSQVWLFRFVSSKPCLRGFLFLIHRI